MRRGCVRVRFTDVLRFGGRGAQRGFDPDMLRRTARRLRIVEVDDTTPSDDGQRRRSAG